MLIKYHDQHIRDYRSDAKYRISGDNFVDVEAPDVSVASVHILGINALQSSISGFEFDPAKSSAKVSNYAFEYDKSSQTGKISCTISTNPPTVLEANITP
jgi:hypothetical protein